MRQVVTTTEAAWLLELDPKTFPAVARRNGVAPLGAVRAGRSTVQRWALADLQQMAPAPVDTLFR